MRVTDYFERIGYVGEVRADIVTLSALCRAHLNAIPFENLDVQLQRPLTTDVSAAFDKIVRRRRGGWCYEMNGLFGWALGEIGFDVARVAGGVMREMAGDGQIGNHLCLVVQLDQAYLVDVGFGGSLRGPLPLTPIERDDGPYRVSLRELPDGHWRFAERARGEPFSFDFQVREADEALFEKKCAFLQSNPASPFVQNLVVQRQTPDAHLILRGSVLSTLRPSSFDKRLLESGEELVGVLRNDFKLDAPEAGALWPAIVERHAALFPPAPAHP